MILKGYKRNDGRYGIRNKVLILPTVVCSSEVAKKISDSVIETSYIGHQVGCGQVGADLDRTIRTMVGLGSNPNIYGVIIVGLGCEVVQPERLYEGIKATGKPVETISIQECDGVTGAIKKGVELARSMVADMSSQEKVEFTFEDLVVAIECGGSDSTSGIASNPALGHASDLIINKGGTVILSETTELIGAEKILADRAINEEVSNELLKVVNNMEKEIGKMGVNITGGNPSPGNIAGGISTIEEKSLGCILKAGTQSLEEVIGYSEKPTQKGLVFMDSPGQDVESLTGMAASGAQICIFTTGRGTPVGNPIMPVIKITANNKTYAKLSDIIDLDASAIVEGNMSIEDFGKQLLMEIVDVVNGKRTKSEILGFNEIGIWRLGISI